MKDFVDNEIKSILEVLKLGLSITFENCARLDGDVENYYIDTYNEDGESLGLWMLNDGGLRSALKDIGF